VREGQAPQTRSEISSQTPTRKEATWSRRNKGRRARHDEEDPCAQSGHYYRTHINVFKCYSIVNDVDVVVFVSEE
jgi:hypothetical protein